MRLSLFVLSILLFGTTTLTAEHNTDRPNREERKQAKASGVDAYPDGGYLIEGVSSKDTFKIVAFLKEQGFEVIGADEGTPLFVYTKFNKKKLRRLLKKNSLTVEKITPAKETDVDWRQNDLSFIIRDRKATWKKKHGPPENSASDLPEGALK